VFEAIALAFALAMDATAVCAARALGAGAPRERVILPLLFGLFQGGFAALGWLGGRRAHAYIADWDHWIAGGVLILIAGHMIVEAWRHGDKGGDGAWQRPGTWPLYVGLAVATSIDAAAAGLTLPLLPVEPLVAVALIGVIPIPCCFMGYAAGRALGAKFGPRLGAVGGIVLLGIAIDILIRAP
jgi:manganese efflux pump family protein